MSSSSSDDDGDADWNAKGIKISKSSGGPKRRSKRQKVEEREEGEVEGDDDDSDDDDDDGQLNSQDNSSSDNNDNDDDDQNVFNDGYDENLMGDEEDQRRLAQMTEKEREQELFNRSEKREVLRTRFEIERKLRLAKKKQNSTTTSNNVTPAHSKASSKETKKQQRANKRRQRYRASEIYSDSDDSDDSDSSSDNSDDSDDIKPSIRKKFDDDDLHGDDDKYSDSPSAKPRRRILTGSSRQHTSQKSETASSRSLMNRSSSHKDDARDSSGSRSSRSSGSSNASDDDENGEEEEDEEEEQRFEVTLADMRSIQMKRGQIEQWCYAPFFRQTAIGLLVRISISNDPLTKAHVYRTGQVVDVVEMSRTYTIGNNVRTNKGVLLRIGQIQRTYQMLYISNNPFEEKDLIKYKEQMAHDSLDFPKRSHFIAKQRDLKNAINYEWKDRDIEQMVAEKMRFRETPFNFAVRKTKLLNELAEAEAKRDDEEMSRIQREIEELERKAAELAKARSSSTFSAITHVNERNRLINIEESEKAIMKMKNDIKTEDPFTRRKCTPTVVSKFTKSSNLSSQSTPNSGDARSSAETNSHPSTDEMRDSPNDNITPITDGGDGGVSRSFNATTITLSVPDKPVTGDDIFAAHTDIHLDIDLEILTD